MSKLGLLIGLAGILGGVPTYAGAQNYLGYVEAQYIRAAPTSAGRLTAVLVSRGQKVSAGTIIATLDDTLEQAQMNEVRAKLAQAQAQVTDLESARRTGEINVIEQQLKQAQAQLKLSRAQADRIRPLAKTGVASAQNLDQALMAVTRDEARVRELESQADLARQATGRDFVIAGARANLESAKAMLAQAEWRLSERRILASADGTISDLIYRPGEMVNAGSAVALIISPAHTMARFYVPQRDLAQIQIGTKVDLRCDGCTKPIIAQISYIASESEFTPPVIYSDQAREKLVYLVEARAIDGMLPIAPGQPINVNLQASARP